MTQDECDAETKSFPFDASALGWRDTKLCDGYAVWVEDEQGAYVWFYALGAWIKEET